MLKFMGGKMTDFIVLDSIMGNGKTSTMIQVFDNRDLTGYRFVIVVPLLSEVMRWKEALQYNFIQPVTPESGQKNKNKTSDLKELLRHHATLIIITHAMFDRFDGEMIELLKEGNYSLVLDEVPTPLRRIDMKKGDIGVYIKAGAMIVDPETNKVSWNKEFENDESDFDDVKALCATGNVVYSPKTKALYKISPYDIYFACDTVYILTYMFEAQIIYYYFLQKNISYKKYSVYHGIDETGCDYYMMCDYKKSYDRTQNWKKLIHICDNKRMNAIGEKRNALSMNWFDKNKAKFGELKKNIRNFSRNICDGKSEEIMWTTYMDYKDSIAINGLKKGFLAINAKATNDFSDKTIVNYIANRFVAPDITRYFNLDDSGLKFDEDAYALSEMLQFIWRSAIRNGKPINLYIPSSRMRGLLEKWIEENSVTDVA